MKGYKDKTELIEEIKKRFLLYNKEFDDIKEKEKDWLKVGVDKTPAQYILSDWLDPTAPAVGS